MSDGSLHIFICYSSKDEAQARAVVAYLEADGLRCWMSSRDVAPGHNYQEAIVHALESARGIVFLFSENSSASGEIKKELSLAGSSSVPVFPLRLTSVTPSGALRYELATRQWIDIFPDREAALKKLAATIRGGLAPAGASEAARPAQATSGDAGQRAVPSAGAPHKGEPVVAAGSEEFEAVRALLARHIGPIAKVMVQKAAAEASTRAGFCEQLAAHVRAPAERAAFLQAARARLAVKT